MAEVVSAVPAQSVSIERTNREIEALRHDLGRILAVRDSVLGVRPFPGQQGDLVDSAQEIIRLAEGALDHEWRDDGESRGRRQHETSERWLFPFSDPSDDHERSQDRQCDQRRGVEEAARSRENPRYDGQPRAAGPELAQSDIEKNQEGGRTADEVEAERLEVEARPEEGIEDPR